MKTYIKKIMNDHGIAVNYNSTFMQQECNLIMKTFLKLFPEKMEELYQIIEEDYFEFLYDTF